MPRFSSKHRHFCFLSFRQHKPASPLPPVTFEDDDRPFAGPEDATQPIPLPGFTDRPLRANSSNDRVDDTLHILWSLLGGIDGEVRSGEGWYSCKSHTLLPFGLFF